MAEAPPPHTYTPCDGRMMTMIIPLLITTQQQLMCCSMLQVSHVGCPGRVRAVWMILEVVEECVHRDGAIIANIMFQCDGDVR